jgi:hypothetical protein
MISLKELKGPVPKKEWPFFMGAAAERKMALLWISTEKIVVPSPLCGRFDKKTVDTPFLLCYIFHTLF